MNNNGNKQLVVIAYGWPSINSGYGLALLSSLEIYKHYFEKIIFIGLTERPIDCIEYDSQIIEWVHIPIIRKKPWVRYMLNLICDDPAIVAHYRSKVFKTKLLDILLSIEKENDHSLYIVFEGVAIAYYLPFIKRHFENVTIAIRSHDVLTVAFQEFTNEESILKALAWNKELKKIKTFEVKVCSKADILWAITETDKDEYYKVLGLSCNGVMGICLKPERYYNVLKGDIFKIVHVGSVDLRKGSGLKKFIKKDWPNVLKKFPKAELWLAGKNTQQLSNSKLNILGLGYIKNDLDLLSKGVIFINPQEAGSGVQLKSIVSMLSGKALVSTRKGVEGIEGQNGMHFLVGESTGNLGNLIVKLIENKTMAFDIGKRAQELTSRIYNESNLIKSTKTEMEELLKIKN